MTPRGNSVLKGDDNGSRSVGGSVIGHRRASHGLSLAGFEANRRNDERMRFEPALIANGRNLNHRFGRHIAGSSASAIKAMPKRGGAGDST